MAIHLTSTSATSTNSTATATAPLPFPVCLCCALWLLTFQNYIYIYFSFFFILWCASHCIESCGPLGNPLVWAELAWLCSCLHNLIDCLISLIDSRIPQPSFDLIKFRFYLFRPGQPASQPIKQIFAVHLSSTLAAFHRQDTKSSPRSQTNCQQAEAQAHRGGVGQWVFTT